VVEVWQHLASGDSRGSLTKGEVRGFRGQKQPAAQEKKGGEASVYQESRRKGNTVAGGEIGCVVTKVALTIQKGRGWGQGRRKPRGWRRARVDAFREKLEGKTQRQKSMGTSKLE